jgi:hypothetical protein
LRFSFGAGTLTIVNHKRDHNSAKGFLRSDGETLDENPRACDHRMEKVLTITDELFDGKGLPDKPFAKCVRSKIAKKTSVYGY